MGVSMNPHPVSCDPESLGLPEFQSRRIVPSNVQVDLLDPFVVQDGEQPSHHFATISAATVAGGNVEVPHLGPPVGSVETECKESNRTIIQKSPPRMLMRLIPGEALPKVPVPASRSLKLCRLWHQFDPVRLYELPEPSDLGFWHSFDLEQTQSSWDS